MKSRITSFSVVLKTRFKYFFLKNKLHVNIKCRILERGAIHVTEKKERVSVEIHNRSYTVVPDDESATHVRLVASLVDQKMKEIQHSNRHLDTASLAVLTALNTMNDYLKLKEEYARLLGSKKRKEEN